MNDSEYTPSDFTQHMMLSYLTTNATLWTKCEPILDGKLFDKEFGKVIEFIKEFNKKYNNMPSKSIIRSETSVLLDIPDDAFNDEICEYVCSKVEEFIRHKSIEHFLLSSAEKITKDSSRNTTALLLKNMEDIVKISLSRDLGYDVHTSMNILKRTQEFDNISTGFKLLDKCLDGGVTMPSFNIVSGSSGRGKSFFLQNLAVKYSEAGYNVIFYSLELKESIILKRYGAIMTDTDMEQVYKTIDGIDYQLKLRSRTEGRIQLKKFPMSAITIADIKAHYTDLLLTTKEKWPVVIIDYMDVMRPLQNGIRLDDIHSKDKYISEEINDFSQDLHHPKIVWTASQQIKGAEIEKESKQSDVSGGTGKVNTCDNLIILKRTLEDIQEERMWGHIEKARSSSGTGKKFPIHWNKSTLKMTDGPEELFIEHNPFLFGKEINKNVKIPSDNYNTNKKLAETTAKKIADRFKKQ